MSEKSILITGATGSFGHAFVEHCLKKDWRRIIVYSRDEVKQSEMAEKFTDPRMRFFIGDVRDKDRLKTAFRDVDTVIHAAALKRIEVGHYNPCELVKTNVLGAMNIVEAANDMGVKNVVGLSTDKAFQPISPYGQSKALAESIFLSANNTRGKSGPIYSVTRYGNVAASRGSVIPKWKEILKTSDTVPVSDPECTRFYMTLQESVDLVQRSIGSGDLNIPILPAYRLGDLAEAMGAKIKVTGLPSWEKRHESMDFGNSSETARRMSVPELREALGRI